MRRGRAAGGAGDGRAEARERGRIAIRGNARNGGARELLSDRAAPKRGRMDAHPTACGACPAPARYCAPGSPGIGGGGGLVKNGRKLTIKLVLCEVAFHFERCPLRTSESRVNLEKWLPEISKNYSHLEKFQESFFGHCVAYFKSLDWFVSCSYRVPFVF